MGTVSDQSKIQIHACADIFGLLFRWNRYLGQCTLARNLESPFWSAQRWCAGTIVPSNTRVFVVDTVGAADRVQYYL